MIELPHAIQLDERIQAVKLPTNCEFGSLEREESAVAIGLGQVEAFSQNLDQRLRQTDVQTMTSSECIRESRRPLDAFSIICANITNGRAVSHGDSGSNLFCWCGIVICADKRVCLMKNVFYHPLQVVHCYEAVISHYSV